MPITLEGIALPEDIQWTDEFSGHGVGQLQSPTLTGALLVEESGQLNGRPISLSSGDRGSWVERSTVSALEALAATPLDSDESLTLVWGDGRSFDVVFDHSKGSPFSAEEVRRLAASAQLTTHKYFITINLLTA